MDLSCIISSGDLELYVLGMLPEEEVKQVEQLIMLFPEVKVEVDRISATIGAFAQESSNLPSPSTKEALFDKFSDLKKSESKDASVRRLKVADNNNIAKVISPGNKRNQFLNVAALLLFLLAASYLIYLVSENRKNKQTIAALERSLQNSNKDLILKQEQASAFTELLAMMQDQNFRQIKLENLPGKPKALVDIFWHRKTDQVMLVDLSLPTAPSGKQYQLWAIVNGKPVNAGMLDGKKIAPQRMHAFEKAEAFAITLEKAGGSETPTLQEMYVMGKVS